MGAEEYDELRRCFCDRQMDTPALPPSLLPVRQASAGGVGESPSQSVGREGRESKGWLAAGCWLLAGLVMIIQSAI